MPRDIEANRRARRAMFSPKADLPIDDERLRALRNPDSPAQTAAYCSGLEIAARAFLANSGFESRSVDIQPLAEQGTLHRLFRITFDDGRRMIARVAIAALSAAAANVLNHSLIVDAWAHRRLRRSGLSGLEVFTVDVSQKLVPFAYELLAEASGRSLREFDHDDAQLQPLLVDLGRKLAQLHALHGTGAGLMTVDDETKGESTHATSIRGAHDAWPAYIHTQLDAHLSICRNLGAIDDRELRTIEKLFAAEDAALASIPLVVLHGDLGNHNIFSDGARITQLIDWEDSLLGDPLFDLANCATFHPVRRHAWLFDGYREYVPIEEAEMRRFHLYFLRIALAKTVLRRRLGIVDLPGRAPAAQRIQLALAALGSTGSSTSHAA